MNRHRPPKLNKKCVKRVAFLKLKKEVSQNLRGKSICSRPLGVCSGSQAIDPSALTPSQQVFTYPEFSGKNDTEISLTINKTPPSLNHCYGHRGNRIYMKREGREFKAFVGSLIPLDFIPWKEKIKVKIHFIWGDKRKHDLDNYLKILLDSMQDRLYTDDNNIIKMPLSKEYQKGVYRVFMTMIKEQEAKKEFSNFSEELAQIDEIKRHCSEINKLILQK